MEKKTYTQEEVQELIEPLLDSMDRWKKIADDYSDLVDRDSKLIYRITNARRVEIYYFLIMGFIFGMIIGHYLGAN